MERARRQTRTRKGDQRLKENFGSAEVGKQNEEKEIKMKFATEP